MQHPAPLAAPSVHSPAWIAQTWLSFAIALVATGVGLLYLPVDAWMKAYLGMGLFFTVGSSFSLAKTLRDQHEAQKLTARVDEARVERLLAEHHPLK